MQFSSNKQRLKLIILCFALLWWLPASATISTGAPTKQLNFKVFLDSKEIGFHRVNIEPAVDGERISVEAQFDVKFLFINAFSYRHQAHELWKDECLQSIETQTTENRSKMFVRSESTVNGLAITSHQSETALAGCIRSFAYWDFNRLNSSRLLNSQTGEHVAAKFRPVGDVSYEFDGKIVPAKKFILQAEDAEISLWYDINDEWISLQTKVKGGRLLAYHRSEPGNHAETR